MKIHTAIVVPCWANVPAVQYKLYPTHVQIPRETPMYRAVKIVGSLTNAIQNILKEPTINTGRDGQALENLAKIFENATENLEAQQQNSSQTSSTPTNQANIRATPRLHAPVIARHAIMHPWCGPYVCACGWHRRGLCTVLLLCF